jgi:acyl carrier protein
VPDILHELQALVANYYGDSAIEVDPDCPMRDLGIDAVGLTGIVAAIEAKFNVILADMVDESNNTITTEQNLRDLTLRQFSECVSQVLGD